MTVEPETDAVCYLAAYDSDGALVRVNARRVTLSDSVTELAFPDFANFGESVRAVKAFLTDGESLPAAIPAEYAVSENVMP